MAFYEYACQKCKLLIPREYDFAKNPSKIKCPECKKMCEQNWAGRDIPVHFKGGGWTTKGGGELQGSSDELNKAMQEGCKKRMGEGWRSYARYTPRQQVFDNARKLSEQEVQAKLKASKEFTAKTYDKAGLDPSMPHKPQ